MLNYVESDRLVLQSRGLNKAMKQKNLHQDFLKIELFDASLEP